MKTLYLIALAILLLNNSVLSQTPCFNKIYHFGEPADNERTSSFIETNTGYMIAGYSYSEDYPEVSDKIQLYEINKSGQLLWSKIFSSDSAFISPTGSRIHQCNDSIYRWFINEYDTINYKIRPVVILFDRNGNLLFSKVLVDPGLTDPENYIANQAIATLDSGFFLVCNNGGWTATLLKFDRNNILEWSRDIGNSPNYIVINTIHQLSDSSYLLGTDYGPYNDGDGRVIHLHKDGAFDWEAHTGGSYRDRCCFALPVWDSTYLIATALTTQVSWMGDPQKGRFVINRIDSNGSVLSEKIIGEETMVPTISALFQLPDSTFVFSGGSAYMSNTYMFRISRDGDSLVYRRLIFPDPSVDASVLVDAGTTHDDGLLFCGEVTLTDITNQWPERPWLIKTDWYGCDYFGCDTSAVYILGKSADVTICKGEPGWFAVKGAGLHLQYQWQELDGAGWVNIPVNGIYGSSRNDTLFILNSDSIGQDRKYRCLVYNDYWRLYSSEMNLLFFEAPEITQQPADRLAKPGESVWFAVSAHGIESPSYQWFHNGNEIPGAILDTLLVQPVTLADTGFYFCVVSNSCGAIVCDTAMLKLNTEGTSDISGTQEITCYPNPVSDHLVIRIPGDINSTAGFVLYTSDLREISRGNFQIYQGKALLELGALPKGIYILRLTIGTKTTSIKLVS